MIRGQMERGTDWEREAVRTRWRELERRHRSATRRLGGLILAILGVLFVLLSLVTDACVVVGPRPHGCTGVVPPTMDAALLLAGPLAVLGGVWVYWRSAGVE